MKKRYQEILSQFNQQVEKVFRMMEFDKDFIEVVIKQLVDQGKMLEGHGITNGKLLPYKSVNMLESICVSGPKRSKYKPIYSQSLVLLVSYFGSTVSSVFNDTLTYYLNHIDEVPKTLAKEEFKFTISELKELEYDLSTEIGRIIARKGDISFQDMQSIYRAFKRYFDIDIVKDEDVDTIIAAQSLRHAIVHNSEIIDKKCKRQLGVASKRKIKKHVSAGGEIVLDREELEVVVDSMRGYLSSLSDMLMESVCV